MNGISLDFSGKIEPATIELYEQLVHAAGYRLEEAGVRLLARDIAGLCGPDLINTLMAILESNAEAGR